MQVHTALGTKAAVFQVIRCITSYDIIRALSMGTRYKFVICKSVRTSL